MLPPLYVHTNNSLKGFTMPTTTYIVMRDVRHADSDEHAAMAHQDIYRGDSFSEAKNALLIKMLGYAAYLDSFKDGWAVRRANAVRNATIDVEKWKDSGFELGSNWSFQSVDTDTIVWKMVKMVRL